MTCPCGGISCFYREQPSSAPGGENIPLQEPGPNEHVITQQPGSTGGREVGLNIMFTGTVLDLAEQAGNLMDKLLDSARMQRLGHYCYRTGTPWCKEHCPSFIQWIWGGCCACCLDTVDDPNNPQSEFLKELINKYGPICVGLAFQQQIQCANKIDKGEPLSNEEKNMLGSSCVVILEKLQQTPTKCIGQSLANLLGDNSLGEELENTSPFSQILNALQEVLMPGVLSPEGPPNCWILQPKQQSLTAATEEEQSLGAVGGYPSCYHPGKKNSLDCRVTCKLNYKTLLIKLSKLEIYSIGTGYIGPLGQAATSIVNLTKQTLKWLVINDIQTFQLSGVGLSLEAKLFEVLTILCLLSQGFIPLDPLNSESPCINPRDSGPWQNLLRELLKSNPEGKTMHRLLQCPDSSPYDNEQERDGRGNESRKEGRLKGLQANVPSLQQRGFKQQDSLDGFSSVGSGTGLGIPLSGDEYWDDPWSPSNQIDLLQKSEKAKYCFRLG